MSAILAGAICNLPRTHPDVRKRAEKAKKAGEWQLKASPPAPPSRGLFPRHLRATFASFFVHLPILSQTPLSLGGKGKKRFKQKIVHYCATVELPPFNYQLPLGLFSIGVDNLNPTSPHNSPSFRASPINRNPSCLCSFAFITKAGV